MVFKRWGLWEVIGSWGWSPHKWDCCSDARSCLTLCNLKNYSTLDSSVLHYLLEFAETHVHWVSDNSNNLILCYPLLFLPSIFPSGTFPLSQLFASCGQSIGASTLATVLPMNIQGWFLFRLTGLISLQSKGLSRVLSNTTIWKHQFFITQTSL